MKKCLFVGLINLVLVVPVMAADGMISVESGYNVAETAERLEGILKEKGMKIFNRIKHSDGANSVGVQLNPTELVIFGNPKVGAPLMKCQQTVAIDLPQKALIWQDDGGKVWITYNEPSYLQSRHGISGCEEVLSKIEKALAGISNAAAAK
ncbi:MAG: DUF302 domain-containing protein [Arenicellales bacterium]|nr:DUF302 domain-containing protein [Arenicellales bacterium]